MPKDFITINQQAAGALARRGAGVLVAQITERTAMHARTLAPGSMKHHIRAIYKSGVMGIVMCDHPASLYVMQGTNPHDIRPRNKSVLRFEVRGRVVYTKLVHHPGNRPNPFLWEALMHAKML